VRGFDKTFLGSYDFAPEELLFQIDRMFSDPGASESMTPWWIDDWDHERDDAVVIGVEPVDGRAWVGLFSAQLTSPRGASGVVALPDRESFAVLCAGAVYRGPSGHHPGLGEWAPSDVAGFSHHHLRGGRTRHRVGAPAGFARVLASPMTGRVARDRCV
jgi:hypothetical protein